MNGIFWCLDSCLRLKLWFNRFVITKNLYKTLPNSLEQEALTLGPDAIAVTVFQRAAALRKLHDTSLEDLEYSQIAAGSLILTTINDCQTKNISKTINHMVDASQAILCPQKSFINSSRTKDISTVESLEDSSIGGRYGQS